jgi:hypothetical protein
MDKTIRINDGRLHIETPNGVINITVGLVDNQGRAVDSIAVMPDKFSGENKVKLSGWHNTRLIRLKTVIN